jgi:hypothetical protein
MNVLPLPFRFPRPQRDVMGRARLIRMGLLKEMSKMKDGERRSCELE